MKAYQKAQQDDIIGTDDAFLVERLGHPISLIMGDPANIKITTPEDLVLAEALFNGIKKRKMNPPFRIGSGYDVHPLSEGRPLIIGGIAIPFPSGLTGHSDADVLSHALGDALLGAAGLGDIGLHFPDSVSSI